MQTLYSANDIVAAAKSTYIQWNHFVNDRNFAPVAVSANGVKFYSQRAADDFKKWLAARARKPKVIAIQGTSLGLGPDVRYATVINSTFVDTAQNVLNKLHTLEEKLVPRGRSPEAPQLDLFSTAAAE